MLDHLADHFGIRHVGAADLEPVVMLSEQHAVHHVLRADGLRQAVDLQPSARLHFPLSSTKFNDGVH